MNSAALAAVSSNVPTELGGVTAVFENGPTVTVRAPGVETTEQRFARADIADALRPITDPNAAPMSERPPFQQRYVLPMAPPANKIQLRAAGSADVPPTASLPKPPKQLSDVARTNVVQKDALPVEQKWIDFHAKFLGELNSIGIDPKGVKSLSRTIHRLGGKNATPFVTAFASGVFGVDIASGTKGVFQLHASTLPFHICSGLALATAVLPNVDVNDIYAGYTARIQKVCKILENNEADPDDYVDLIKGVLEHHSKKTTVRFLTEFYELKALKLMGVSEARTSFRSWMNELLRPLDAAIKKIEADLTAMRIAKRLQIRNGEDEQYDQTDGEESESD